MRSPPLQVWRLQQDRLNCDGGTQQQMNLPPSECTVTLVFRLPVQMRPRTSQPRRDSRM